MDKAGAGEGAQLQLVPNSLCVLKGFSFYGSGSVRAPRADLTCQPLSAVL